MASNRNYLADFCLAQPPIVGYDNSRGFVVVDDKGTKHYSEIEDWRYAIQDDVDKDPSLILGESKVYINPMIRQFFFTLDMAATYLGRAMADIDPQASLILMDIYNTFGPPPADAPNVLPPDPLGRAAYYLLVPSVSAERIPLNRLRYLASSGNDRNGVQVYDDKTYVIEVDGPGTFTYTAPVDGADEGVLTFLPPKR